MIKKEEKCICDRCGRIIKGGRPRSRYLFTQPVVVILDEQYAVDSSAMIKGIDNRGELSFITAKIEEIKESEIRRSIAASIEVSVKTGISKSHYDLCPECHKKIKKFLENDKYDA